MKALILDADTTEIISMIHSQTKIMERDVYLVERIDRGNKEVLNHLKAIVFVRPTLENVNLVAKELRRPRFQEYHLFFSNIVPPDFVQILAEADKKEV